jgi:membrane-bound metal-dependent hydrolase YbcI (DUF457 family)
MLLGASLAALPDLDLILSWGLGFSTTTHGAFTHSIIFSLIAGLLACLMMREINPGGFLVYSSAAMSHGLLDALVKSEFGGSALLWPLSPEKIKLGLFSYFEFYPSPATDPLGPIIERALDICIYEMMIFMPIFIIVVWCRRWQDRSSVRYRLGMQYSVDRA